MNLIRASTKWCTTNESTPTWFWSSILKNQEFVISDGLKDLIRTAMVIPVGSAAAERTFYQMNYIKTKQRARLTPKNIDHICRIRMNGPDVRCINIHLYTFPGHCLYTHILNYIRFIKLFRYLAKIKSTVVTIPNHGTE